MFDTLMGSLAGLYDLRLNDAHAAAEKATTGIRLLGIDPSQPLVHQGERLLSSTAQILEQAAQVVENWER